MIDSSPMYGQAQWLLGELLRQVLEMRRDVEAVQAAMTQVGADTVITLAAGHTITLQNVTASNLHANDFLFM